ncbi:Beta/gamma crystallin [Macrophomina phaseolina MS6]|uniref:Beta/gamma crystallin n=2 Tax=Macrophomina phaseolina TaxID=35725 RepID=K2SW27_MACPH|nr:Beta/gamma crystallin [Macrophomina phaseolina MS6]KAH7050321.1 hypothetical protein B0J12DRAFT_728551 [Macrophomina phaseolina]
MQPIFLAFSAVIALALPGSASPVQLEARQGRDSIRLFSSKDYSGEWADVAITDYDKCIALPSSMKDNISSFKLGRFNCRFFEHDNCGGRNYWFTEDIANLRAPSGSGYDGSQNDELSSAICVYK